MIFVLELATVAKYKIYIGRLCHNERFRSCQKCSILFLEKETSLHFFGFKLRLLL